MKKEDEKEDIRQTIDSSNEEFSLFDSDTDKPKQTISNDGELASLFGINKENPEPVLDRIEAELNLEEDDDDDDEDDEEFDDVENLTSTKEGVDYFVATNYPNVYDLLKESDYFPETIDEINYYLKDNILEIGKRESIDATYTKYVNNKLKKFNVNISKNNFFNAYFHKIWEELTIPERAQVLAWHFETKKEQLKVRDAKLRLFLEEVDLDAIDSKGMTYQNNDGHITIFIDPELLFNDSPIELMQTLEHEFEHVKQQLLGNYLEYRHLTPKNTYELMQYFNVFVLDMKNLDSVVKDALYIGDTNEMAAEKRALKNTIKLCMINSKYYKLSDRKQIDLVKNFIKSFKYRNYLMTVDDAVKYDNLDTVGKEEYLRAQEIVKNREYINKLNILRRYNKYMHNTEKVKEINSYIVKFIKNLDMDNNYVDKEIKILQSDDEEVLVEENTISNNK